MIANCLKNNKQKITLIKGTFWVIDYNTDKFSLSNWSHKPNDNLISEHILFSYQIWIRFIVFFSFLGSIAFTDCPAELDKWREAWVQEIQDSIRGLSG